MSIENHNVYEQWKSCWLLAETVEAESFPATDVNSSWVKGQSLFLTKLSQEEFALTSYWNVSKLIYLEYFSSYQGP